MKKIKIALAGNPNSGKSTLFNAITGARQHIANYPGVTVEKKYGEREYKGYEITVVDLPGIYSLTAYSIEEVVARDFIINERPDLVVDIVDASNLERNLYLTVQLMEIGVPVILALNMMDIAESRGIFIDIEKFSEILEVPAVPMVARENKGIDELLEKIIETAENVKEWKPLFISYGMDIDNAIRQIEALIRDSSVDKRYPVRWLAIKYIEQDPYVIEIIEKDPDISEKAKSIYKELETHLLNTLDEEPEAIIAEHRYGYISGVVKNVVKKRIEERISLSDRLDKILTNRILGPSIMFFVLYVIYIFTFKVSEIPVNWIEGFFSYLKSKVSALLSEGIFKSLIISGIIDGVGSVLVFVPLIMAMFFSIAILEDSGYMARIAYMMDRILRSFGLHGNSILSLIVSGGISGGCAVPGVFAARTLRDTKERIATVLVTPFMNCGAKIPVYAMLVSAFFSKDKPKMMFLLTLLSWTFSLIAAKIIRSTVLKGPSSPFVMELPPYRLPTFRGLMIHTWERTWQYLKKAGTVILAFSVIMWFLLTFPGLSKKEEKMFQEQKKRLIKDTLVFPLTEWVKDEKELEELNKAYSDYLSAIRKKEISEIERIERTYFFPVIYTSYCLSYKIPVHVKDELKRASFLFLEFRKRSKFLKKTEESVKIKKTYAARLAKKLEYFTRPLGFDYRINISLIGGFAAKEVILSTLSTAYSLTEEEGFLSEKLKNDPSWNKLKAFVLMIFIMLYVPCIATVAAIIKETSWKWGIFSICFNLLFAYTVSFLTLKIGKVIT